MGRRVQLQALLKTLCDNVYFQPPENIQMQYPCIVYHRDRAITRSANNKPYTHVKGYQVTIIDSDPDSEIPDKVSDLPMCLFNRFYVVGQLNHDVYTLFF